MTKPGVLLLSHCGFSFMEDLLDSLRARGLRSFVLSSSPLQALKPKRLEQLSQISDRLICTDAHVLTADDVESALAHLKELGETVLACISVWEGYREFMARANAGLGIADLGVVQVERLRNKLTVRNRLAAARLTQAKAVPLTYENFNELKADSKRRFVKPVCGIASYGAFALRPESSWSAIASIVREAQSDEIYRSAFGSELEFMAEDYVQGREFSFELLVVDGRVHTLAIHEKCEITETQGTVLEDACVSPPVSIDAPACAAGIKWLTQVFQSLELDWGCFHVEARHDGTRWDLIEINPRVGGCLISPSVKALNGQAGVLELWLDLLIAESAAATGSLDIFEAQLAAMSFRPDGTPPYKQATFFRAYFASVGTIEHVALRNVEPLPILSQLFLKPGDQVTQTSREVFLGQLLWRISRARTEAALPELMRMSAQAVEVRYAASDAALVAS
jgi:hypothetical protein